MRIVVFGGIAAAAVLLSGCATVTRGTSQKYMIESTPTKAEVTLSTGQQCVTPCTLKLKRKPGFTATVAMKGYKTQKLDVESKMSGGGAVAGAGNVILGGVVGALVDGTNGSLNNLTPNPLKVTLLPEEAAEAPAVAVAPAEAAAPAAEAPATPTAEAPAASAAPAVGHN
jgi:hypothetical protein